MKEWQVYWEADDDGDYSLVRGEFVVLADNIEQALTKAKTYVADDKIRIFSIDELTEEE